MEIRGRVESIQITALSKSARILSWRLEETCCFSEFSVKVSVNANLKNSQMSKIFNNKYNSRTVYGDHANLESGIDSGRTKLSGVRSKEAYSRGMHYHHYYL